MYVLNNWAVELSSNCAQRRLWKFMGDLVAQPSVWTFDLQNWTMYPVCILSAHVVYSTYQVACNIFFPILVHVVTKKTCRAQLCITDLTTYVPGTCFLKRRYIEYQASPQETQSFSRAALDWSTLHWYSLYISQCTLYSTDVAKAPAHYFVSKLWSLWCCKGEVKVYVGTFVFQAGFPSLLPMFRHPGSCVQV